MPELRLPVSEIFGPTLQGEGVHSGRRAIFVRIAGCDSRCEWCDTPYAKATEGCDLLETDEVIRAVQDKGSCRLVVLTGGNPCIQDLRLLVARLKKMHYEIHVETQGTLCPSWLRMADLVTICPKIYHDAGRDRAYNFIRGIRQQVPIQLKYVVFTEADFQEAMALAKKFPTQTTVIQPGWDPKTDTYPFGFRALAERVARDAPHDHVRFLPQLHRLIWGGVRGV